LDGRLPKRYISLKESSGILNIVPNENKSKESRLLRTKPHAAEICHGIHGGELYKEDYKQMLKEMVENEPQEETKEETKEVMVKEIKSTTNKVVYIKDTDLSDIQLEFYNHIKDTIKPIIWTKASRFYRNEQNDRQKMANWLKSGNTKIMQNCICIKKIGELIYVKSTSR
jgi:hypothetical protein